MMTPTAAYETLVYCHRNGRWLDCLILARLLRDWLTKTGTPRLRDWEERLPVLAEIEADAKRRTEGLTLTLTREGTNPVDFTASNGGAGGSYEKPRPGTYTGVLIGFSDLGTHTGQYGAKRRVMLRWELHKRKGPVLDSAGHVLTVTAMYNASFDVKSSLRPVIEAHLGPVKDGENCPSEKWLGQAAKLVLKESDDGKYVNVDTVTPLDPEEDEAPKQQEAQEHWEMKDGVQAPGWALYMVKRSEEWKRKHGEANGALVPAGAGAGNDDSTPF